MNIKGSEDKNIAVAFLKLIKNRNILIFAIFFMISASLWFLNAVNKEYNTEMKLGFQFENLPEKAELSKESQGDLTIIVRGHGYNILREKAERIKLPVTINLKSKTDKIILQRTPYDFNKGYILSSDLIPIFDKRYGDNIKVLKIKPDTIYFNLAESYKKKLPVIAQIEFSADKEYMITGDPKYTPDSVFVYGPKNIVDSLQYVKTKKIKLENIGEKNISEIKLETLNNLSYSKSKILVSIPVEKFTETEIELSIQIANAPDSIKAILIPEKTSVLFKVPLSSFDKITASDFTVIADFDKQKLNSIPLDIISNNPLVEITGAKNNHVSFILEKTK
jgi:hypothetical protein